MDVKYFCGINFCDSSPLKWRILRENFLLNFPELIFVFQENRLDFLELNFAIFAIQKFRNIYSSEISQLYRDRDYRDRKRVATVQINSTCGIIFFAIDQI